MIIKDTAIVHYRGDECTIKHPEEYKIELSEKTIEKAKQPILRMIEKRMDI